MNFRLIVLMLLIFPGKESLSQRLLSPESLKHINKPHWIWTADWSADDKYIAIAGDDSLIRIFNAATMQLHKVYIMQNNVKHVSWHPSKNLLAIAGRFSTIHLLDISSNDTLAMSGLKYGSRTIDWNFDGTMLAAADGAGMVRIWDARGNLLRSISKPDDNSYLSLDWHPSRNLLLVSGDDIRMMDTAGNTLHVIKHRKEQTGILTVRWHPSGNFFTSGDYGHADEGIPSLLQYWDTTGKLLNTIIESRKEYRILSWSKDGEWLAASGDALRIYNKSGKLLFKEKNQSRVIWGLDWNRNNQKIILATFDGDVRLHDKKARLLKTIH